MEPFDYTATFNSNSTGLRFCTLDEAFNWAYDTAKKLRFYLIRTSVKRGNQYFHCQCAARQGSVVSLSNERQSSTRRTDCQFRGSIKHKKDGFWHIDIINGCHNHPFTLYRAGQSHETRLDEFDKEKVRELRRAQCKLKEIVAALSHSNPEKPYIPKSIYNFNQRVRSEDMDGRNTAQQFLQVSRLKKYFLKHIADSKTDRLKALFWANPNAIKLLRTYPQVICIDATYGTNKYNFALVQFVGVTPTNKNFTAGQALLEHEDKKNYFWALQCLRDLLGPYVHPNAILTDRELGLIEPVQMVFPKSGHILCMWHIKKMIRARATTIMGNGDEADRLFYGSLNRMIKSPTVERFQENELKWRKSTSWLPSFVQYFDDTWMPHKEKFAHAWINRIMHYGNTTTNRVESAHRALKDWFPSCKGSLDTLFEKVHLEIESQITAVEMTLEWSRSKLLRGFDVPLYKNLPRQVSHKCLDLLHGEYFKTRRCNHAFLTTHGLPCKCKLHCYEGEMCISLNDIDKFWRTLAYGEDHAQVDLDPYHLRTMMQEVYKKDPAAQLDFGNMIRNKLYPDHCNYYEPEVKETKKGRPSKKKGSMTRKLSGWEHVDLNFGSQPKARGIIYDELDEFGEPPCTHAAIRDLPPYMRDYLISVYDVHGDGNCGFRCAAQEFLGNENSYPTVRGHMSSEVGYHPEYIEMYNGLSGRDAALQRINLRSNRCHEDNWMSTEDLFAMAQVYNAMVSYYSFSTTHTNWACVTFLPWRGELCQYTLPLREISIIHMEERQHYVVATFRSSPNGSPDHPLPPVHPTWRTVCSDSLRLLELEYGSRLRRYESLVQAAGFHAPVSCPTNQIDISLGDDEVSSDYDDDSSDYDDDDHHLGDYDLGGGDDDDDDD